VCVCVRACVYTYCDDMYIFKMRQEVLERYIYIKKRKKEKMLYIQDEAGGTGAPLSVFTSCSGFRVCAFFSFFPFFDLNSSIHQCGDFELN
jgi:hypothetical protein